MKKLLKLIALALVLQLSVSSYSSGAYAYTFTGVNQAETKLVAAVNKIKNPEVKADYLKAIAKFDAIKDKVSAKAKPTAEEIQNVQNLFLQLASWIGF